MNTSKLMAINTCIFNKCYFTFFFKNGLIQTLGKKIQTIVAISGVNKLGEHVH